MSCRIMRSWSSVQPKAAIGAPSHAKAPSGRPAAVNVLTCEEDGVVEARVEVWGEDKADRVSGPVGYVFGTLDHRYCVQCCPPKLHSRPTGPCQHTGSAAGSEATGAILTQYSSCTDSER